MKKIILILLASLAMSFTVMADGTGWPAEKSFYCGLKGGLDAPLNTDGSDVFFTGGLFAGYNFNGILSLQMELNYFGVYVSYDIQVFSPSYSRPIEDTITNYIQIPLLLKASYLKSKQYSPYVDFGPVFDSIFAISSNLGNLPLTYTYMSLGGIIGLGIDFPYEGGNALEVEVRADQSIVNNSGITTLPIFLFITIGYIF
jgi:hypothetical protein